MDDWHIGDSRFRSLSRQRRRRLDRALLWAALPVALAGFLVGYLRHSGALRSEQADKFRASAASPARLAALDAIDEALRAKHEKRTTGVLAALDQARRADPSTPGLDIAFAELALNEKEFVEMRRAAVTARRNGDHASGASVLLGMDKWLARGRSDREMSAAADMASGYFAEATETDFFAAPAWFFWGDVLRYAGREGEGHDCSLAALRRFEPWDSSDIIMAKAILASAEAGDTVFAGLTFLPDSPWARAIRDAANAQKVGTAVSPETLAPFAARPTLNALASDRFFGSPQPWRFPWPLLP